ncbi:hypothetical protein K493DRAFT_406048 [Basidiobolus meristosporus CBS 931.73]|uniref:WD40 repeat-like protein n=1 Tax=Basidiobolus meristosporus CBS 931.73 TaxID=1314790 RepID=A0A1Y1YPK9_9FUNG|nr:hypothetical protein K493DRAFT_406048 [Basidiobolus meristosporus CBS 931.73]|eukprot:ORX99915.1 hypothetical protein K493DRAFT_406048 [Basidiobolus meristosporus CBS 931.73]
MASNLVKPTPNCKDRNALKYYADAIKQYSAIKKERPLTPEETVTYKRILEKIRFKMANTLEKVQAKYSTRKRGETPDLFSSNDTRESPSRCGSFVGSLPSVYSSTGENSMTENELESGSISRSTTDIKLEDTVGECPGPLEKQPSVMTTETDSSYTSRHSSFSGPSKRKSKEVELLTTPSSVELRAQQNKRTTDLKRALIVSALESLGNTEWERFKRPFTLPTHIIDDANRYKELQMRKSASSSSKKRRNSAKRKAGEKAARESLQATPVQYYSEAKTHQVAVVITPRKRTSEEYQAPVAGSAGEGTVTPNHPNVAQGSTSLVESVAMSPLKQGSASFQCISQRMKVSQIVISSQKFLIAVDTAEKLCVWKFASNRSTYSWDEIFTYTYPNYRTLFRTIIFTRSDEFLIVTEIINIVRPNESDAYYMRITTINLSLETHTSVNLPISLNISRLKELPVAVPNHQSKLIVSSGELGELVIYHFEEDWSILISDIPLPKSNTATSAIVSVKLVENEPSLIVGTSSNSVTLWNIDKCSLLHSIPFPDDIAFQSIPKCISAVSPIKYVRMKAMARTINEPLVIIMVADVCHGQGPKATTQVESCQQYILYQGQLNHLGSLESCSSITSLSTSQKCVVGCVNDTDVVLWNKNSGRIISTLKLTTDESTVSPFIIKTCT